MYIINYGDKKCKIITGIRQFESNCWFAATMFALFYTRDTFNIFSRYILFAKNEGTDYEAKNLNILRGLFIRLIAGMLRENTNLLTSTEAKLLTGTTGNLYPYVSDTKNALISKISKMISTEIYGFK